MTDDEAKLEVEEKLRKQQLTKPMTDVELAAFCNAMLRNLELTSRSALRHSSLVRRLASKVVSVKFVSMMRALGQ